MIMIEQWETIPGWEYYEVSTNGSVRRTHTPAGRRLDHARFLKPYFHKNHLQIDLYMQGRKRKTFAHTLVLEAFVSPRPLGKECRHVNGIGTDNRLENLAWGTHIENYQDSIKHGVSKLLRGNKNLLPFGHPKKLTLEIAKNIREEYVPYRITQPMLAKKYGVHRSMIQAIVDGKAWVV